jgi:hypothetical protein
MPTLPDIPTVLAIAAAGVLIARAAYRRSTKRSADDLRPEINAEQESLRAAIGKLPGLIDLRRRSRTAAARAAGNTGPDGMQQWLSELDIDLSEAELLSSQLPAADLDYQALSDIDVELKLVEVLALSLRASALIDKYPASISAHETDRETQTDDAEALLREASQYSLNNTSSIVESVGSVG